MTTRPVSAKCKACKQPATMLVGRDLGRTWVCSEACGATIALKRAAKVAKDKARESVRQAKEERKAQRLLRKSVKPRRKLLSEVQAACNAYVRARDAGKPCGSCGRPDDGTHQRHAGHYRSVGSHPELRFNPINIMTTCAQCNQYGGGGLHPGYRPELINRVGLDRVLWLEGPHAPAKWTDEELEAMKVNFRANERRLRSKRERSGEVGVGR